MIEIYSNWCNKKYNKKFIDSFIAIYNYTNQLLKQKDKLVEINFVSQNEIKKINSKYRNKNSVTDVISFAFDESMASKMVLGEIYICTKRAKKQAKEFGHSLTREMCFLFVHGLLHLYGYDHINKKDEEIMFKLQEKILQHCKIYREK